MDEIVNMWKYNIASLVRGGRLSFNGKNIYWSIDFRYCYTHLLDLVGKKVDNPIVDLYKARFPHHKIQESERGI